MSYREAADTAARIARVLALIEADAQMVRYVNLVRLREDAAEVARIMGLNTDAEEVPMTVMPRAGVREGVARARPIAVGDRVAQPPHE